MSAVAAHVLAPRLDPAAMRMVRDGVQMQGWHALALVLCGIWAPRGGRWAQAAGFAFALGILLFCGSVYAFAIGGLRLPLTAPAGGWLLMAGWALLGISALRVA
ncbi:MAG TPA: DUF423 domain-containing protein [Acetobacteraceae bacterium]|nr:DUF423 domain-containing protein [Acetobacteraceae bacterium]